MCCGGPERLKDKGAHTACMQDEGCGTRGEEGALIGTVSVQGGWQVGTVSIRGITAPAPIPPEHAAGGVEAWSAGRKLDGRCRDSTAATTLVHIHIRAQFIAFSTVSAHALIIPVMYPWHTLAQDKTRANAAGALGNLVRNSSTLCGELIRSGALKALLDTALTPERPATVGARAGGGGADAGGSPVKIALFSLGNMCAHRECRESLLALGVNDMIRRLAANPDPTQQKYLQRIQQKLSAGAAPPAPGAPGAGR